MSLSVWSVTARIESIVDRHCPVTVNRLLGVCFREFLP